MSKFTELNSTEINDINGGITGLDDAVVGLVSLCGAAIVGGFQAGRQFVRDLRNKK